MLTKTFRLLIVAAAFAAGSWSQSDAQQAWGALAACCYPANGKACGAGVSTGFGTGSTQAEAASNARTDAMSDTDQSPNWRCSTARTFNRGCGYIAGACEDNPDRCAWVLGATQEEVIRKLRAQGYRSPETDGGCVGQ